MNRIKYLRESIRMTQKELGDRIGQTSSNISKYETGLLEPNIKTLSAMAVSPVKAPIQVPGKDCPHLEYDLYLSNSGEKDVNLYVSPSLNYFNDEGLKVAVSIDDQAPQILAFNKTDRAWNNWVSDNIIKVPSKHQIENPGKHVLKVWMVTPGVVLQKIVVNSGDKKSSYLGEPESVLIK